MDDYATAIIAAFGGMLVLLVIIGSLQVLVAWRAMLRSRREGREIARRVEKLLTRCTLSEEEKASLRKIKARAEKERKLHGTP